MKNSMQNFNEKIWIKNLIKTSFKKFDENLKEKLLAKIR